MRFAKEAWPFVLPFFLLAALLAGFQLWLWAAVAAVAGVLVLLFFRDPARRFDGAPEILVAPADGLVTSVEGVEDGEVGPGAYTRVVTFLSVFDVHVQRVPTAGEVVASALTSGRKEAAFKKGLDRINERHLSVIERPGGERIGVRQIVGLLARRIVCTLQPGQKVSRGQLMGLIKFGSRVDLLVPASYEILVAKGDRVRNGETPMARPGSPAGGAS